MSSVTATRPGWSMYCPAAECQNGGGPWPTAGEARHLATVHDRLHHGDGRTAQVFAGEPVIHRFPAGRGPDSGIQITAASGVSVQGGGER